MKALCNTLMQSLWQGVVLAAIGGAVVMFTKKAKAAYRYNLLVGAITLFALGVTITFIMRLQKPANIGASHFTYTTAGATPGVPVNTIDPAIKGPGGAGIKQPGIGNVFQGAVNYFNMHYA